MSSNSFIQINSQKLQLAFEQVALAVQQKRNPCAILAVVNSHNLIRSEAFSTKVNVTKIQMGKVFCRQTTLI